MNSSSSARYYFVRMETIMPIALKAQLSIRRWLKKHGSLYSFYLIMRNTLTEFAEDGSPQMAAGIAFFIFFSVFPILLIGISIAGYRLSNPEVMMNVRHFLEQFVPTFTDFIMENVRAVAQARGSTGIIGLLGLIWAGRGMFLAMEFSLNRAWGNTPSRSFIGRNLVAILLIFFIGLILILSVVLSSVLAYVSSIRVPILDVSLSDLRMIRTINQVIISTFLIFIIFTVLYKVLPHSKLTIRNVIPGAIFATILWKIAEAGYLWYISNMANLAELYGSIGSIIGILLWLYIAAIVFLLGAQFNISYLRRRSLTKRK